MLKKLYDKSAIGFAVTWIAAYCILMSIGDAVSDASVTMQILSCVMLTVISGGYGLYIALNMRKNT